MQESASLRASTSFGWSFTRGEVDVIRTDQRTTNSQYIQFGPNVASHIVSWSSAIRMEDRNEVWPDPAEDFERNPSHAARESIRTELLDIDRSWSMGEIQVVTAS